MASAAVLETSVPNDSPSQDSDHPDDIFQSRYVSPEFKPFSYNDDECGGNNSDDFMMIIITKMIVTMHLSTFLNY